MAMDDPFSVWSPMTNPFLDVISEPGKVEEKGVKRYAKLFAKGATLGLAGKDVNAEGIPEHLTEFAGSIIPITAITGGLGAAANATRAGAALARLGATGSRMAIASGAGATYEGAKAGIQGKGIEDIATSALQGAGEFAAGEGLWIGAGKLYNKLQAARAATKIPKIETNATNEVSSKVDDIISGTSTPEQLKMRAEFQLKDTSVPPSIGELGSTETMAAPTPTRFGPIPKETPSIEEPQLDLFGLNKTYFPEAAGGLPVKDTPLVSKPSGEGRVTIDDFTNTGDIKKGVDLTTNLETLTPTSPEAESALGMLRQAPIQRTVGPPLTSEEAASLSRPEISNMIDKIASDREAGSVTNLLKLPDDTLDATMDVIVPEPGKLVILEKSSQYKEIAKEIERIGLTNEEWKIAKATATARFNEVKADIEKRGGVVDEKAGKRIRETLYLEELKKLRPC